MYYYNHVVGITNAAHLEKMKVILIPPVQTSSICRFMYWKKARCVSFNLFIVYINVTGGTFLQTYFTYIIYSRSKLASYTIKTYKLIKEHQEKEVMSLSLKIKYMLQ